MEKEEEEEMKDEENQRGHKELKVHLIGYKFNQCLCIMNIHAHWNRSNTFYTPF